MRMAESDSGWFPPPPAEPVSTRSRIPVNTGAGTARAVRRATKNTMAPGHGGGEDEPECRLSLL